MTLKCRWDVVLAWIVVVGVIVTGLTLAYLAAPGVVFAFLVIVLVTSALLWAVGTLGAYYGW